MYKNLRRTALMVALLAGAGSNADAAGDGKVARGKYLATLAGCGDCHTPGYFLGKPDMKRAFAGSEVGFEVPEVGAFYGPNLTPDRATGLGGWSREQIVTAIRSGKRPDGRQLFPVMPWPAYANMTRADAEAIAAFLQSLPAVTNQVPGPFGAKDKPTSFVMRVIPPDPPSAK